MSTTNDRPTLLIAYDGSPEADRAIAAAARFLPGDGIVLTAYESVARQAALAAGVSGIMAPDSVSDGPDPARAEATHRAEQGVAVATGHGLRARAHVVESSTAVWSAICSAADELDVDVIVTGTRGTTGLRSLLQSSVADHVLRHSGRPVFIVPPED